MIDERSLRKLNTDENWPVALCMYHMGGTAKESRAPLLTKLTRHTLPELIMDVENGPLETTQAFQAPWKNGHRPMTSLPNGWESPYLNKYTSTHLLLCPGGVMAPSQDCWHGR